MLALAYVFGATPMALARSPLTWHSPVRISSAKVVSTFGNSLNAVSCPSGSLCVAVGQRGGVATLDDPAGGPTSPTQSFHLPGLGDLIAVSCPSVKLCVALDAGGEAAVSTDPGGGVGAWRTYRADPIQKAGRSAVMALSCPTVSFCIAVTGDQSTSQPGDGGDDLVMSSAHPARASAWRLGANLPESSVGDPGTDGVSCPSPQLCAVVDSSGDVWTSAKPLGHRSDWKRITLQETDLTGISCPTATLCVATEDGDLHVTASPTGSAKTWQDLGAEYVPVPFGEETFTGVSCASASLCVAVTNEGNAYVSTQPTVGSSWTVDKIDSKLAGAGGDGSAAVSCVVPAVCAAVDSSGDAIVSGDGSGGAGAWTPYQALPPTRAVNPAPLQAVSCATTSLCVAGDNRGDVIASGRPAAGGHAWRTRRIGRRRPGTTRGYPLAAISCAPPSFCAAADTAGDVFTTGRAPSGSWQSATVDPHSPLVSLSCPSPRLCVGVNATQAVVSTTPVGPGRAWHRATIDSQPADFYGDTTSLTAVSCASPALCAAVDSGTGLVGGDALTTTDPNGGSPRWRSRVIDYRDDEFNSLNDVSCTGGSFCVAVDDQGFAATTTDPGSGHWRFTKLVDDDGLVSVSCGARSLCVAVDSTGLAFVSTDPGGGRRAWAKKRIDPAIDGLAAVSCPAASFCVAVDHAGRAIVATA